MKSVFVLSAARMFWKQQRLIHAVVGETAVDLLYGKQLLLKTFLSLRLKNLLKRKGLTSSKASKVKPARNSMPTLYSKKILQPGLNLKVKNKVCHGDTL